MTRTERLLNLTRRMVRLESELTLLRAEFARLCGDPVSSAGAARRTRSSASIATMAQSFLDERAPARATITETAVAIGATKESTAAALSKLVYAGRARREFAGVYASVLLKPPESTE